MKNRKIYFVMPAYNEAENIRDVVEEWYPVVENVGPDARLVIADDGSKDQTYRMMCDLAQSRPQFIPLHKSNSGHGATLMYLYDYAIRDGAEYVFQTDSDGQTRPAEFAAFLDDIDRYDIQIGTRYAREDGFGRVVVTKVLKALVWLEFGVVVKDANTPFRLMKADTLAGLMSYIPSDFFLCNVAISALAVKSHIEIGWHPITFRPRQGGVNSINIKRIFKIGIKAISDLAKIRKNYKAKNINK